MRRTTRSQLDLHVSTFGLKIRSIKNRLAIQSYGNHCMSCSTMEAYRHKLLRVQLPLPSSDVGMSAVKIVSQLIMIIRGFPSQKNNTVTHIENYAGLSDQLWYGGFAVECDHCDQRIQWGLEGSFIGTPGQPRFSQNQVLCNRCLSNDLYAKIGAWLVVGLAASCNSETCNGHPSPGLSIANEPISYLIDSLLKTVPITSYDQLVPLLGVEAQLPEVRATVLQKARAGVSIVLGSHISPKDCAKVVESAPRGSKRMKPSFSSEKHSASMKPIKSSRLTLQEHTHSASPLEVPV